MVMVLWDWPAQGDYRPAIGPPQVIKPVCVRLFMLKIIELCYISL